jgi:hypothetical protein
MTRQFLILEECLREYMTIQNRQQQRQQDRTDLGEQQQG